MCRFEWVGLDEKMQLARLKRCQLNLNQPRSRANYSIERATSYVLRYINSFIASVFIFVCLLNSFIEFDPYSYQNHDRITHQRQLNIVQHMLYIHSNSTLRKPGEGTEKLEKPTPHCRTSNPFRCAYDASRNGQYSQQHQTFKILPNKN